MLKSSLALISVSIALKRHSKLHCAALHIVLIMCSPWAQPEPSDLYRLFHLILRITLGVRCIMAVSQMSQLWFGDVNLPRVSQLGDKVVRRPDSVAILLVSLHHGLWLGRVCWCLQRLFFLIPPCASEVFSFAYKLPHWLFPGFSPNFF